MHPRARTGGPSRRPKTTALALPPQVPQDLIVARTFDYEGEATCERHMSTFLKSIEAAAAAEGQGFAAIKARRRWPRPPPVFCEVMIG